MSDREGSLLLVKKRQKMCIFIIFERFIDVFSYSNVNDCLLQLNTTVH